jgi:hypothetical protein
LHAARTHDRSGAGKLYLPANGGSIASGDRQVGVTAVLQQRVSARQILRFELGPGAGARRKLGRGPVQQDHEVGGDILLSELLGGVEEPRVRGFCQQA